MPPGFLPTATTQSEISAFQLKSRHSKPHVYAVQAAKIAESDMAQEDAPLHALRYQLKPHFLFNTLNASKARITVTAGREIAKRLPAESR
jgi:hypothetical protein